MASTWRPNRVKVRRIEPSTNARIRITIRSGIPKYSF
jgi:hypothetical protein